MTKRILLIGPLIANKGHGAECGIYDALRELGHDVFCYDPRVNEIQAEDEIVTSLWGSFKNFAAEMTDWDLILCPGPGIPPKLHESGLLGMVRGTKVLWNSEPIRLENYRSRVDKQKDSFDLIATFDESELPKYAKMGGPRAFYLPQAFNPKWYQPIHDIPLGDFAFVGSMGGKWSNRSAFLNAVNDICQKRGWSFRAHQTFDANEVNRIYNNSKVVLNLGLYHPETGPVGAFKAFALQQRIFEAIGSGRVTLTHDFGTKTNQTLTPSDNVVCYDGPDNLEWAMQYAHTYWDDLSSNILKVRDQHSYKARMETLLAEV